MKRRYILGVTFAFIALAFEFLSIPLMLSGARPYIEYILYTPSLVAERFLFFARTNWHWPIPRGDMSPFSREWDFALLVFNWFCYGALGFVLGLRLDRFLQRRDRTRHTNS